MALLVICGPVAFGSVTQRVAVPLCALTLLLGLLWACKLAAAEAVSWKKTLMHFPVAAFAVYAVLRYATSPLEYESRLELVRIGICTLLYFIAACNFYHRSDRTILLVALLLVGLGESIFGMWQLAVKPTTIFGFDRPEVFLHRASGTFFCPNHLAGFLEMVLCMGVAYLTLHHSSKMDVQKLVVLKVVLAFVLFIILLGFLATMSRGGLASLAVGLLVLLPFGGFKWGRLAPRLLVVGVGVGVLLLLVLKFDGLNARYLKGYWTMKGDESKSTSMATSIPRTKVWLSTIAMIRERPLWGSGGGTWEWFYPKHRSDKMPSNPEYAHNDVLNLLSDYGLVGFALIAIAFTCFYGHAYALARSEQPPDERAFAVGSAMAATAILAHSMVDFNMHIFSNAAVLMTLMGFTVAMEVTPESGERVLMEPSGRLILGLTLLVVCVAGGWVMGRSALAYHYVALGDYAKSALELELAQVRYRHAIRLDPRNPQPYLKLGDTSLSQSEWRRQPARRTERENLAREAVYWYDKAISLNPYNSQALLNLARAHDVLGNKEEVVKACNRLITNDPVNPVVHIFLSRFYLHQKDLDRAENAAKQALKCNFGYDDPTPTLILEEIRSLRAAPQ